MINVCYRWEEFDLIYNCETGNTTTYYKDGGISGCDPVPDDEFHAERLGITNKLHRLQHELIHHLLFIKKGIKSGSDIIFKDAHKIPLDKRSAELEEWKVTAFQYFMFDKNCQDYGALLDLSKEIDLAKTKKEALWLFNAAQQNSTMIIHLF